MNGSLVVLPGQILAIAAIVVPPVLTGMRVGPRWPVKAMFMWSGLLALALLTNAESCLEGSPSCSDLFSSFGLGLGLLFVLGIAVLAVIWRVTRPKKHDHAATPTEDAPPGDAPSSSGTGAV